MANRMTDIKPDRLVTKKECQEMIDDAIRRHNRNASIISMCVGWVVLALFAEGLLRLIGVIPPVLPWLNITLK
jgi:predicted nucleic acid-binding Zn ribbon protein